MLTLKNLSVSINDKDILHDISTTFEKGKVYAVMGPNGSGKSTLAGAIMGHPAYEVSETSKILLNNKDITEDEPHERAQKGIFMSFQSPVALSGVSIYQMMRYALKDEDPVAVRKRIHTYAKKLNINEALLSRSLNDGFSGGERKKMEVLQATVMNPDVLVFDEIDTGVDVDALKSIAQTIKRHLTKDKVVILITHYNRILSYLKPDHVLVVHEGNIAAEGDHTLAEKIEQNGYASIVS